MPSMRLLAHTTRITLVALIVWLVPAAVSAALTPTELRVSAPAVASVGDVVQLRATLSAADGSPIVGARVVVYERLGFMGVSSRDVAIASGQTQDDGVAAIRFTARREGPRALSVRFAGDDANGAADAALELPVAAGVATHTVEGAPGVPGVSRLLLIAAIVIAWGTMFFVAFNVVQIARDGLVAEGAEERES
jgi:hypothetical protein